MNAAEIRSMISPKVADLETWQPDDPECWAFGISLEIGIEGQPGIDVFYGTVCSPVWLRRHVEMCGPRTGRGLIVLARYDWPTLERFLREKVRECSGGSWEEIAGRLQRWLTWEYEDVKTG
ncbi:MAG: immunity 8 family protein [Actinomycetota bacterium]